MTTCDLCGREFCSDESGLPDICAKCERQMDEEYAEELNDFSEDICHE